MRLKEFLRESDEELRKSILASDDMKELSEMVEHLRQPNTKKFLADNDLIFRGMKDMPRDLSNVYTVWSNRTPKDSGEKWHNLYNKALKSFDDNKEWRSNSLFVTRKRNIAGNYGSTMAIIPLDAPKFLYSEYVSDMFGDIEMQVDGFVDRVMSGSIVTTRGSNKFPQSEIKQLEKIVTDSKAWIDYQNACKFYIEKMSDIAKIDHEKIVGKLMGKINGDAATRVGRLAVRAFSGRLDDYDFDESVWRKCLSEFRDQYEQLNSPIDEYDFAKTFKDAQYDFQKQLFEQMHFDSITDNLNRLFTDWTCEFAKRAYKLTDEVPKVDGEIMMRCNEYLAINVYTLEDIAIRINHVFKRDTEFNKGLDIILRELSETKTDEEILDIVSKI